MNEFDAALKNFPAFSWFVLRRAGWVKVNKPVRAVEPRSKDQPQACSQAGGAGSINDDIYLVLINAFSLYQLQVK